MKIYTSYFANLKKIPKEYVVVSIARWQPKWYKGCTALGLAPSEELLSWWKNSTQTAADQEKFINEYNKQLAALDIEKVISTFEIISEGKPIVLVCYEKKEDFCHRQLVAKWLNDNGYLCEEFDGK